MAQSVARALNAIKRYKMRPEQIDGAIIAAINVTLCLVSGGDARVAEGFNKDMCERSRLPTRTGEMSRARARSPLAAADGGRRVAASAS
jgi:cell division protein ZapA (FtsZ GTPase activity inhibitor)